MQHHYLVLRFLKKTLKCRTKKKSILIHFYNNNNLNNKLKLIKNNLPKIKKK